MTGCNTLPGDYKLDESTIFLHVKTTEKKEEACKNADVEKNFLAALASTAYWEIKGENLTLFDDMDNILVTFKAIYF